MPLSFNELSTLANAPRVVLKASHGFLATAVWYSAVRFDPVPVVEEAMVKESETFWFGFNAMSME